MDEIEFKDEYEIDKVILIASREILIEQRWL